MGIIELDNGYYIELIEDGNAKMIEFKTFKQ